MSRFALEPIYGSMAVAILAAIAIALVVAFFTPETVDPQKRRILILLRSLAAIVLLLAAFGPSLVRTDNRPADATLVVAVDTSQSMTLPDGDGSDRWSSQVEAFRTLATGLQGLDESLSIKLVAYDKEARSIDSSVPDALADISPDGDLTDLSAAAESAINVASGQPMAGVILMGDGTHTASVADDGARRVAETLRSLGVPLWSVPIGPAGGREANRDVAVDSLPESLSLFAGNEFEISFQVQLRGLAGVSVPIRMTWIDANGVETDAASRSVVASNAMDVAAVSVPMIAPDPGTYRLSVSALEQDGEWVTQNNRQIAFVDVREGGGRILYLEGMARVEQKFLRRSLKRFPDLDLTYRWIPSRLVSGGVGVDRSLQNPSSQWPIDLSDRFRPGKFDVYLLGDLDSRALGDEQLEQLTEAVAQGAGLITLGGYQTYGVGGYADSPLADVLPIRMDDSIDGNFDPTLQSPSGQLDGPIRLVLSQSHPITDLGSGPPEEVWKALPAAPGANKWLGVKSVPGVQVLLKTEKEVPLLVVGEYGRGRVASVAFDSTWQWWRSGKTEAHRRFWRQLMLWALAREETNDSEIQIEMDQRRFTTADAPTFRARVESLGDVASDQPSMKLIVETEDETGQTVSVPATAATGSALGTALASIRGTIPKSEPGFYKLRVRPADEASTIQPSTLTYQVIEESRELDRPMADPVYLRQLADLTVDHGGASFASDEINELLRVISERRIKAEIPIIEKHRLGDGPVTGWLVFLVFATALSVEWLLRRRWMLA